MRPLEAPAAPAAEIVELVLLVWRLVDRGSVFALLCNGPNVEGNGTENDGNEEEEGREEADADETTAEADADVESVLGKGIVPALPASVGRVGR